MNAGSSCGVALADRSFCIHVEKRVRKVAMRVVLRPARVVRLVRTGSGCRVARAWALAERPKTTLPVSAQKVTGSGLDRAVPTATPVARPGPYEDVLKLVAETMCSAALDTLVRYSRYVRR